jgi:hypothetical protein
LPRTGTWRSVEVRLRLRHGLEEPDRDIVHLCGGFEYLVEIERRGAAAIVQDGLESGVSARFGLPLQIGCRRAGRSDVTYRHNFSPLSKLLQNAPIVNYLSVFKTKQAASAVPAAFIPDARRLGPRRS